MSEINWRPHVLDLYLGKMLVDSEGNDLTYHHSGHGGWDLEVKAKNLRVEDVDGIQLCALLNLAGAREAK